MYIHLRSLNHSGNRMAVSNATHALFHNYAPFSTIPTERQSSISICHGTILNLLKISIVSVMDITYDSLHQSLPFQRCLHSASRFPQ